MAETQAFNSKTFGNDGQLEETVRGASFRDEDLLRAFYTVTKCASKMAA